MALSLSCACGAAFEVEDTFAGQTIACPDCAAALKVPPLRPPQVQTSGYALASVVLALVGAFTVVGTAAAVALGVIALVSIARHRDRLSGAGYAVLGIVLGTGLTLATGFAFSRGEVFDQIRAQTSASQVDKTGPMEIVRADDGFAITRPSRDWGVATPELIATLHAAEGDLVLANPLKNAFAQVMHRDAGRQTLDAYRETFLSEFRDDAPVKQPKKLDDLMRFTEFHLRQSKRLPNLGTAEVMEVTFDVKMAGQALTYVARLLKPAGRTDVYGIVVWTHTRRMQQIEPDVRRIIDSFRLL